MISSTDCNLMVQMFIRESEHARQAEIERQANLAYIELNNLYLQIQSGKKRLTITTANTLRVLVGKAYPSGDSILTNWWNEQFQRLPNWNNV